MLFNLDLSTLISRLIILVIAFTVHEFAHAWTATRFGDRTPAAYGRLTLNPLAHLDPMGSLLLLVAGFGWAKPVPINPIALNRKSSFGTMWVSLAGPLSNLTMAILAAIPFRLGIVPILGLLPSKQILPSPAMFLWEFITINLALVLFNLLPIAPLDGEKVASALLPPPMSKFMDVIRPYGPIILIVVAIVLPYVGINILGVLLVSGISSLRLLLTGL